MCSKNKTKKFWRKKGGGGGESTVTLLPKHSFAQPIYFKSGSMICCKLKTKTKNTNKNFSQIGSKQSDHFTTDKAVWWLNLIQCPFWVLTATDTVSGNPWETATGYPGAHRSLQRLKGIVGSRVLSRGVTCLQKCLHYSFQWYYQLSGTCLWLMKEGTVRQSWGPRDGACVFHVDVVHGWQSGKLCRFAATVADVARARRAFSFLSYEFV